jgi:hypothetical protein
MFCTPLNNTATAVRYDITLKKKATFSTVLYKEVAHDFQNLSDTEICLRMKGC